MALVTRPRTLLASGPLSGMDALERLLREAAANPEVINFAGGLPSQAQFPRRGLTDAFVRALSKPGGSALQYGWPEGEPSLRAWIAARLAARGAAVTADDVIVTSGAQQAIALAVDLVARPGDRIAVDPESYAAALQLFRTRGLVPTTDLACARLAYVMPALANPRGTRLDDAARVALQARGLPVIEDDAYAELRFDGPPPPPLLAADRARTFHVGTFSKTLCPGLRVGWLVPPPRLRRRARRLKADDDLQANGLAQAILADFLAREDFDARLRRLRRYYAEKAATLLDAVSRQLPAWRWRAPEGGFSIWLECDDTAPELDFLARAVERGVCADPGSLFRVDGAGAPLAIRVSFSALDASLLAPGVARLRDAWRAHRGRRAVSFTPAAAWPPATPRRRRRPTTRAAERRR